MRFKAPVLLVVLCSIPGLLYAQVRLPILDMHLHARNADYIGPDPPPMCAPFAMMPRWDASKPGMEGFIFNAMPPCAEPIMPAVTDEAVMKDTLAVMRKRNIIGMVSGDILYNNAARFLRLSQAQTDAHHRLGVE